ncbi:MAG: acetyl-coenzyme A synthetase N-terminal domain-containing protein, partial [Pseudomonadota bacterium]
MSSIHKVDKAWSERAWIDRAGYEAMYRRSVEDNEAFWAEQGQRIDWIKPYTQVKDVSYARDDLHIRWYYDGTLNVCHNCLDRHLPEKADETAIIWEGDDPANDLTLTYGELHARV